MLTAKSYTVRYHRDEAGWWVAQVVEVPSAITQGRSLSEARRRIQESLSLALADDEPTSWAELRDVVQMPAEAKRLVVSASSERARARASTERAERATSKAAVKLTQKYGFSLRDAGDVLGLSHQRVQQLVSEPSRRGSRSQRGSRPSRATARPRRR